MEIFAESQVQKEKFKIAANKLLNSCFIIKKKEDTRSDYIFILQNNEMFTEYFNLLGYSLVINETQGVIALNSSTGTGRLRLKKIESIILLILRLLYIEKRKDLSLTEDVMVLSEEIHQKYSMLKIQAKPNLDKTTLREAARLFKKYNIILPIDRDVTTVDARIKIYPSVLLAMPNDNLNNIYEYVNERLNQYAMGGESNDDEETGQD
ncbi:MAG TPA: hypothetical protein DCG38_05665 [Eubacteriaceae bacterium]|jgi:hypothetical protein|nr:hypothetical protein [Eubacteriaceae bacterium]